MYLFLNYLYYNLIFWQSENVIIYTRPSFDPVGQS